MKSPYAILGQWEAMTDILLHYASVQHDETLFVKVVRMRELHAEMFESLKEQERTKLEEQLTASISITEAKS